MVAPAALLVAALASMGPPPVEARGEPPHPRAPWSVRPQCDAADLTLDEEAVAAAADDEAAAGEHACEPVAVAPIVLACNDDAAEPWTQDMIGSCDMPRTAPSSLQAQAPRRDRPAACRGPGCGFDPWQLRAGPRSDDGRTSLLGALFALVPPAAGSALVPSSIPAPRSAHGPRLERPPRSSAS